MLEGHRILEGRAWELKEWAARLAGVGWQSLATKGRLDRQSPRQWVASIGGLC
jgi:hypothetical protein